MELKEYRAQAPFGQRHLLTLQEYTPDEILQVLSLAAKLKAMRQAKDFSYRPLTNQKMAMVFTKPSMRTRVSFEVGCHELGGYAFPLTHAEIGLGERETVEDVARVLSRFCDGIMIRTFAQADVDGLAKHGSIPVINGLTDDAHPCQALADMLTLYEHKGGFAGKRLCYVGDGNNVAASLLVICAKLGVNISLGCPKGYEPPAELFASVCDEAAASGADIMVTDDPKAAAAGADAIYTDVWVSMGQEAETEAKNRIFAPYQVDSALMRCAKPDAIFLHCLPAVRGYEVTDEVIENRQSVVFDEAENRLHAQKAVMALLMGEGKLPQ